MIYSLLAYKDVETEKFNLPMLFPFSIDAAIENVIDACKKGKVDGAEYYHLYAFGTFDTATGLFDLQEPKLVAKLEEFVKRG